VSTDQEENDTAQRKIRGEWCHERAGTSCRTHEENDTAQRKIRGEWCHSSGGDGHVDRPHEENDTAQRKIRGEWCHSSGGDGHVDRPHEENDTMKHQNQIKKLALGRETVRKLSVKELGYAAGGDGVSQGGSECESVMICKTLTCLTQCGGCTIWG
jgi:hypothetical protein